MNDRHFTDTPRNAWLIVFALWAFAVLLSFIMVPGTVNALDFSDPDDAQRLMQVRDFLNGQSWFDVTQYRSNPPFGGPMHWSRLVDLPIAALILIFRPIFGTHLAEVIACVTVPAGTLGLLFVVLFRSTRRLTGTNVALFSCLLLATSIPILVQTKPLRIDHHAWQIVMIGIAAGALIMQSPRKGGIIAGLATALGLHISSEGLPVAAITGAIMALRYANDPKEWPRFAGYMLCLFAGSALILVATHGWQASLVPYCDAMSPAYIAPLGLIAVSLMAAQRLLPDTTPIWRLAIAGIAATIGGAYFLTTAGPCLKGPFEILDPLVYQFWYLNVLEGRPIWVQEAAMPALVLAPSLLGGVGYVLALRAEQNRERKIAWLSLLAMMAGAAIVACLVTRAMSAAHFLALPGNAVLVARLYRPVLRFTRPLARVGATLALCLFTPIGITFASYAALTSNASADAQAPRPPMQKQVQLLNQLAPSILLAPLDIGPEVLVNTHHKVISTGHHRNSAMMKIVLEAFLSPPSKAHAIILGTRAQYILIGPHMNETDNYRKFSPNGLGVQLIDGNIPPWLHRVNVPGLKLLTLYRIER